ncbi:hypothetical protein ACIA79_26040, partial [Streptomyces sp. NPDC051310]
MFTAIFQDHYGYLVACTLVALVFGAGAWLLARRLRSPHGVWFACLAATVAGVLGVTFMGSGPASGQCVVNHDVLEPFRTTQGLWNLAMTVPLGFFALMAARRPPLCPSPTPTPSSGSRTTRWPPRARCASPTTG